MQWSGSNGPIFFFFTTPMKGVIIKGSYYALLQSLDFVLGVY